MGLSIFLLLGLFVLDAVPQMAAIVAPFRFVLGLLMVLYLPGYCLTVALFPRRSDLDNIERVGLSMGLSIAWVSVLALLLNIFPSGLRFWPIVWGEVLGIGVFMATAVYRRYRLPRYELYTPAPLLPRHWWQQKNKVEKRLLWSCLAALVLIAVGVVVLLTAVSTQERATEFYMLSEAGLAENFPHQTTVDTPIGLILGIHNEEATAQTYRIEIVQRDVWTDTQTVLQIIEDISLASGETWQEAITWQMATAGNDQQVAIFLYADDDQLPYRELRFWLDVEE